MWKEFITATSVQEATRHLGEKGYHARIVAGATDLILELERGVRQDVETLIDVTRIPDLDRIAIDEDNVIHLGAMVTHNDCVASKLIRERAYPLARAAWEVGAPQIRNRATVAGNLITASPANDTITPLMALEAWVILASPRGERRVALKEFYTGVRKTVMEPDEMMVEIAFPALDEMRRGTFIKLALRRAQAISVINVASILDIKATKVKSASITLGAVAPTIIHATEAERFLSGKKISPKVVAEAARLAMEASRPIDDIRGSADYRREMVRVCTARSLTAIAQENGLGRLWSPMVELLADRELATGEKVNWDVLPQLQVTLSRRQHIRANIGVRFPVNNTGSRSTQLVFYLLWDWFDGGLRDGW